MAGSGAVLSGGASDAHDVMLGRLSEAVEGAERDARGSSDLADRLCRAVVETTAADGAAITVSFTGTMAVPVGTSSEAALRAEEVQFAIGRGPCHLALERDAPVLLADLDGPQDPGEPDLQLYAREVAERTPWRGVAALPFRSVGDLRTVLIVYTERPVRHEEVLPLPVRTRAVALVVDALRRSVAGGSPPAWLDAATTRRRGLVWVAEEAVARAGGTDLDDALARLRARAFADGTSVEDVALSLVEGGIALDDLAGR